MMCDKCFTAPKILLHACCAVCLGYPLQVLKEKGYEVVVLFYNPNIFPIEEYERRKAEVIRFCEDEKIELVLIEDDENVFLSAVNGLEEEAERGNRCEKCFELRLEKTAQIAFEKSIGVFSTTLSVSPHKNYNQIKAASVRMAQKYSVDFAPFDFKKQNGFKLTSEIANKHGFYRQNYCGCKFSFR